MEHNHDNITKVHHWSFLLPNHLQAYVMYDIYLFPISKLGIGSNNYVLMNPPQHHTEHGFFSYDWIVEFFKNNISLQVIRQEKGRMMHLWCYQGYLICKWSYDADSIWGAPFQRTTETRRRMPPLMICKLLRWLKPLGPYHNVQKANVYLLSSCIHGVLRCSL